MEIKVFCIYDAKVEAFQKPIFFRTTGEALRGFIDLCGTPDNIFHKHPEDFTLFHIANYDESKGRFENLLAPVSIGTAIEYVKPAGSQESR